MPELPEVETIKRDLEKELTGAVLKRVIIHNEKFLKRYHLSEGDFKVIEGKPLENLHRKGKFLSLLFDSKALVFHLGLTGALILNPAVSQSSHQHHDLLTLLFDKGRLLFKDLRKFGKVFLLSRKDLPEFLGHIGTDALEISPEDFKRLISHHRGRIKEFFLSQKHIAGLGNIYTDELLFRARISPFRRGLDLSEEEILKLYQEMRTLLTEAIASRGSSIRDYVDGEGKRGHFQVRHLVYGKAGSPCPICQTPLKRTIIAQRGTTYCPNCQK